APHEYLLRQHPRGLPGTGQDRLRDGPGGQLIGPVTQRVHAPSLPDGRRAVLLCSPRRSLRSSARGPATVSLYVAGAGLRCSQSARCTDPLAFALAPLLGPAVPARRAVTRTAALRCSLAVGSLADRRTRCQ